MTDFDNGARPVTASRAGLRCRGVTPEAQRAESFLRLQQFLARDVLRYSPFYRRKFAAVGLTAGDIRSETDFAAKVPYTTKDELREHHPDFVLRPNWPGKPTDPAVEEMPADRVATYYEQAAKNVRRSASCRCFRPENISASTAIFWSPC